MSEDWTRYIRDVPDFPKPGIMFKDLTPMLANARALHQAIEALAAGFDKGDVDVVLGPESRGFIFGAAVAQRLEAGFVPIRKPGKLPWRTVRQEYDLEYGKDCLEMHEDAVQPGQRVLLVDDVLATGGTAAAAVALAQKIGGRVVGAAFVIELGFLAGRRQLNSIPVHSLHIY